MKLNTIAVLGGGPGGLYAARLLKLSHPDARVSVYEQGVPDKTFGFGVGLASRTQRNLRSADSESLAAIVAAAHSHDMSMWVGDQQARLSHGDLLAIGRAELLSLLQQFAERSGVSLHFDARRSVTDLDADLIIAADGVNSATRTELADDFKPQLEEGKGLYLWCGTEFALPSAVFVPATTDHGTFVAHAYPYAADRSTFLIETDESTWARAGFDDTTRRTPTSGSDQASLDYLQEAFADALQGHRLIGNRTRWLRFRTVHCDTWHTRNIVLLGDAAHTAHYSIGSGTKLAMEDAIALDRAVQAAGTLGEALDAYEQERRPAVDHLQSTAARSMLWWDSFPERMSAMPVDQLMIAYMTRAGKVSVERFAESASHVVRRGVAAYADVTEDDVPMGDGLVEWILSRPLNYGQYRFGGRIAPSGLRTDVATHTVDVGTVAAWGASADRLLHGLPEAQVYWLTGPSDHDAVLNRLELAERVRRHVAGVTVVDVPPERRSDAVAALVSERTHLVALTS
ncbi:FAD-dependent monooxygenase [Mycolicibacterium baixiangningiae]|uniref:FAD-dependent monooxygenase n=1 Tax=Mycolicibacterium baixiangningiae TaxID=2761578 RepID=UPI0018D02F1B|nr:FAD-dependent monooxygenase [Mycolicibacterium baixiangningiae]